MCESLTAVLGACERSGLSVRLRSSTRSLLVWAVFVLAFAAAAPAAARDDDGQLWLRLGGSADVRERLNLQLETNQRFSDDRDGLYESQYLAALAFDAGRGVKLTGGINRVVAYEGGEVSSTEWRPRQQVSAPIAEFAGGAFAGRLRAEQRFRDHSNDVGHRLRPEIAFTRPLGESAKVRLSHESYFNLNATPFQDSGHERMRNAVTVILDLADTVTAEVGYLNQHRFDNNPDRSEHVLNLALSVGF